MPSGSRDAAGLGRRWSPSCPGLHGPELISRAAFRFKDRVLIEGVSDCNALRRGRLGEK